MQYHVFDPDGLVHIDPPIKTAKILGAYFYAKRQMPLGDLHTARRNKLGKAPPRFTYVLTARKEHRAVLVRKLGTGYFVCKKPLNRLLGRERIIVA